MTTVARTRLLAALLAVGVGLVGCGDGGSRPSGAPTTVAGASGGGDVTDPLVRYSACMRENGAPSFPDPVGGRLRIQARKGGDLDPSSSTFKAAQEACRSLEPAGTAAGGGAGREQQDAMLRFVACMRENGVTGFPDPQPDGRLLVDGKSGIDPESPEFAAAQETCRRLLPGGVAPGPA